MSNIDVKSSFIEEHAQGNKSDMKKKRGLRVKIPSFHVDPIAYIDCDTREKVMDNLNKKICIE